jgi:hypothetical protein
VTASQVADLTTSLPVPKAITGAHLIPRGDDVACVVRSQQMLIKLATILNKLGDSLRLGCCPPGVRCLQPRSPARWLGRCCSPDGIAPPEELNPRFCTPNPAPPPPPARAWAERHHNGGRRRPSRRLYSVRTPRGWLGPARGEFLGPNSPLGPPPVLLADFWATGRANNPLDSVRWVVPIKARGRYTLCSAIHRPRRRRPAGA